MSAFPQTYWTMIQRASRTAFNRIARDYAAPVRAFIERGGFGPQDAEDLAQEVFLIVCDAEFLRQADASKGRFRTLVLLVTKNVMNAEWRKRYAKKRRGKAISLDGATVAEMLAAPAAPDASFDREWWRSLLDAALAELRREDPKRHEILHLHKNLETPHAEIAERLGISAVTVNNEIRAAKKRMRELLLDRVRAYCSSPGEFEEEVAQLRSMLGA